MAIHIEFDLDYTGHKQIDEDNYAASETVEEAILRYAGECAYQQVMAKGNIRWEGIQAATRVRDDLLRERIEPIVEAALEKAVQPTDSYGQAKGEPVTMTEVITKIATEYLTKESGNYNNRETVIQKLIREQVSRVLDGELAKVMTLAKAEIKQAVQLKGAEILAKTIQDLAKPA